MKLYDFHSTPFDFQAGAFLKFATSAALADYDDRLVENGGVVFVESYRDYFQKIVESPAPVAASGTIVPTSTGDGGWYRLGIESPSWSSQATWYIDPLTGDDENDGNTTDTALATFAEFDRRVTMVLVPMTVTILSDTTENLVGTFETSPGTLDTAYLIVKGTPVVLTSGLGTFTAHTSGTNDRNTVAVAGVADFADYEGYFLRAPEIDALTGPFHNTILKSAGATAYTGFWSRRNLSATAPANGIVYEIIRMPTVGCFQINATNLITRVYYLETLSSTSVSRRNFIQYTGQRSNAALVGSADVYACKLNNSSICARSQFTAGCCFAVAAMFYNWGGYCALYGCNTIGVNPAITWIGQWLLSEFTVQGGRIVIGQATTSTGNVVVEIVGGGGVGVYGSTDAASGAVAIERCATLAGANRLFGDGNAGWGLTIKNGGRAFMTTTAPTSPTITGAAGQEVQVDGAATAISPLVAGGAVPAASPLTTWAHWAGAPFNKYVFNYSNGTTLAVLT